MATEHPTQGKRPRKRKPLVPEIWDPETLFVGPKRYELLRRIATLATELCISVDRAAEDIGGSRPALTILQDMGPLTDQLEQFDEAMRKHAEQKRRHRSAPGVRL